MCKHTHPQIHTISFTIWEQDSFLDRYSTSTTGIPCTKCVKVCVCACVHTHTQRGGKWSRRKRYNTVGSTLMVPQEDLWIRTAWRSTERERRSLSTEREQSENTWHWILLIFLLPFVSVCVCACKCVWKRERVREIDQRHQPALLPSRINCISVTGFHSSNLQHISTLLQVTPWLFQKGLWERHPMVSIFGLNMASGHHVY